MGNIHQQAIVEYKYFHALNFDCKLEINNCPMILLIDYYRVDAS